MCCLNGSRLRHPAGKLREQAEKSPHDLGWALAMSKKLGYLKAQLEFSNLIDAELERMQDGTFSAVGVLKDLKKKIEDLSEGGNK